MTASLRTSLAMLLLMGAAPGCTRLTGFDFVVTFTETKSIQPGTPVLERGLPIGEVVALALQGDRVAFRVRVEGKYKNRICRESKIAIDSMQNSRALVVSTPTGVCTPLLKGQVLEGEQNLIDALKEVIRNVP